MTRLGEYTIIMHPVRPSNIIFVHPKSFADSSAHRCTNIMYTHQSQNLCHVNYSNSQYLSSRDYTSSSSVTSMATYVACGSPSCVVGSTKQYVAQNSSKHVSPEYTKNSVKSWL